MCNRHSFILTKSGKVFWGLGITDSHTQIREFAGLHANDDTVNAYEWQPPKGWPDADWNLGLTKDSVVFETKSSHENAIERHLKKMYPTMDEWNTPDSFYRISRDDFIRYGWTEIEDGQTVTPNKGDRPTAEHRLFQPANLTCRVQPYCWNGTNYPVLPPQSMSLSR